MHTGLFCFICADPLSHHANMRANLEGIQMHHLVSDENTRNGPDSMSAVSMPVCTCIIHTLLIDISHSFEMKLI